MGLGEPYLIFSWFQIQRKCPYFIMTLQFYLNSFLVTPSLLFLVRMNSSSFSNTMVPVHKITRLAAAEKKTFPGRVGWLDQLGMKSTQSLLSWGLGWAWQKCHQLYRDFYEHFNLLKEGHLDWILNHHFNIWNFLNGSRPNKRIN